MTAGQQIALKPTLAHVLGQHAVHHAAACGQEFVGVQTLGVPLAVGDLENVAQAVGHSLVRAEYAHTGSSAAYTDKTTGEKTRGKVDEQMYYLIAGYKFKGKYMPVIRYDVFNGKRNTYLPGSVGKQQDFLVGFLYMPIPRLKAQAAWTLSKSSAAGAKNGNGFEVALIGFF